MAAELARASLAARSPNMSELEESVGGRSAPVGTARVGTVPFALVCAISGALTVEPSIVATPLAAVIAALFGVIGLRVWRWSHLPSAVIPSASVRAPIVRAVAWFAVGLAAGLMLLGTIRFVLQPFVPGAGARIAAAGTLSVARRIAIVYVAAVSEELVFRLILLSAIAGIATRCSRRAVPTPTPGVRWLAIALSALAFGAAHIPAWSAIGRVDLPVVLMVMTLNGLGGALMGYVFTTRGIVAAMCVHAGADCAIQLIGPLTG
jgi:membrane protease YdiL (CAAX protease family)